MLSGGVETPERRRRMSSDMLRGTLGMLVTLEGLPSLGVSQGLEVSWPMERKVSAEELADLARFSSAWQGQNQELLAVPKTMGFGRVVHSRVVHG